MLLLGKSHFPEPRAQESSPQTTMLVPVEPIRTTDQAVLTPYNQSPSPPHEESTEIVKQLPREFSLARAFPQNASLLLESASLSAVSAIGIRTARPRQAVCSPLCSCACHLETQIQSPRFLSSVLGALFISYGGMPVQKRACTEGSCRVAAQPSASITYYFPPWLLARMVYVFFNMTPLAGPSASLKVHRTVPGDAEVFAHARTGNVARIKELFEQQLASPHDVHAESGVSPLHVRECPFSWPASSNCL